MGEVFITRKGGGGKAATPTIAVTEVGGTWIELEITNNDAAASGASIFVLANYDPNSAADFDLQASQNGFVFAVAQGATVTQLVTGLDPDTSHTVSVSAAVIKKLPSSIVTTDSVSLLGVPAPTLGTISDTLSAEVLIPVTNNDTQIPLTIRVAATTTTAVPTTYPFELVVQPNSTSNMTITGLTDTQTYYYHARAFDGTFQSNNVVIGPFVKADNPLYAFTTWTFTNAGITGRIGPTITEVRTAYSSESWAQDNDYLAMTINGIQNWTAPGTGSYQIEAWGAAGGGIGGGGNGGLGARMRGDVSLTKGEIIRILVGQQGVPTANTNCCDGAGGGGGSFVVRSPFNTTASILVIAGGGGGHDTSVSTAVIGGTTGTSGLTDQNNTGNGGTNGNGGAAGSGTGGGGGFSGNGGAAGASAGGSSFTNGGVGGSSPRSGGFGGGGGGDNGAGGGGGYSGGAGAGYQAGGGGGSFNSGTNQSNSAGARSGAGQVIITKL